LLTHFYEREREREIFIDEGIKENPQRYDSKIMTKIKMK